MIIASILSFFIIPETKGKTHREMDEELVKNLKGLCGLYKLSEEKKIHNKRTKQKRIRIQMIFYI